ncbi:MAG: mechanosensitive ion channel [Leptospiraceae bacterium]|nr:mechanosensitive ion channel [Leptospiraceae bacterium]
MKELFELHISQFYLIEFIFIGIILVTFFIGLNKIIPKLQLKYKNFQKVNQYLPLLQLFTTVVFLNYFFHKIFQLAPIYYFSFYIIIFIVLVAGSYDYIRNALEGIYLRSENSIGLYSYISSKKFSGKVKEMGIFSIILEEGDRKEIRVPYRILNQEPILKENFSKNIMEHKFYLDIKATLNLNEVEKLIRKVLLTHSWVSLKKPARINPIPSSEKSMIRLELIIYSIEDNYNKEIESKIIKSVKELE